MIKSYSRQKIIINYHNLNIQIKFMKKILKEQFKILIFNIFIYIFLSISFFIRTKVVPMDNIFSLLMENLISPGIYIPDIIKTYLKYQLPFESLFVILINQLFYTYFSKKYWENPKFKKVWKFILILYFVYLLLVFLGM